MTAVRKARATREIKQSGRHGAPPRRWRVTQRAGIAIPVPRKPAPREPAPAAQPAPTQQAASSGAGAQHAVVTSSNGHGYTGTAVAQTCGTRAEAAAAVAQACGI